MYQMKQNKKEKGKSIRKISQMGKEMRGRDREREREGEGEMLERESMDEIEKLGRE